jgi:NADH-quinone oxidoreductase subunit H
VLALVFLVLFFVGETGEDEAAEDESGAPVDAFAGGFPVPPMPAGGPVRGGAAPLTFADRRTTVTSSGTDHDDPAGARGARAGEENR